MKQIKGNGPDKNVGYVNLTLKVDFTNEGSTHAAGYRVSKYQFSHTSPDGNYYSSVDMVLLRYAEIFMMRAEAKLRKGDSSGALADMNTVRTSRTARAPIPAAASCNQFSYFVQRIWFRILLGRFKKKHSNPFQPF